MTHKRPLSVIMPCYNEATVVGRAIESILNQSFSDFEFIIVDDGSTDGTFEICAAYANRDDRIHLFRLEENSGSCTRPLNVAIEKSTAPILARMDADDVSYPERFERQYAFLMAHPEVDVLGTGIRLMDIKTGRFLRACFFEEKHKDIVRKKYRKPILVHPSVMLRKEIYETYNGYDPKKWKVEDYDLWLKALPRYTFHNLQEVLLDYYHTEIPKGQTPFIFFKDQFLLKFETMEKNKELLRYFPMLFIDVLTFTGGRLRKIFLKM